jgi:hypothetical protein
LFANLATTDADAAVGPICDGQIEKYSLIAGMAAILGASLGTSQAANSLCVMTYDSLSAAREWWALVNTAQADVIRIQKFGSSADPPRIRWLILRQFLQGHRVLSRYPITQLLNKGRCRHYFFRYRFENCSN